MTSLFLTIAEAVEKTGRSPSTIRRLIRTITDTHSHSDRDGIQPTPAVVAGLKKKGENFTWTIREDVLHKNLKGALKEEKKSASLEKQGILQILQKELDLKSQQIAKQWEVIHALNDRLREGNILMGALQKRLTLPEPDSPTPSTIDASTVPSSTEATVKPSKEAVMAGSKKTGRRGILRWMFR